MNRRAILMSGLLAPIGFIAAKLMPRKQPGVTRTVLPSGWERTEWTSNDFVVDGKSMDCHVIVHRLKP